MVRPFSHLLGTVGMLLVMLLWISLLNPPKADHLVDSLAGAQHEYVIVLGAALLSVVFSFIAAIRGSKWWYLAVAQEDCCCKIAMMLIDWVVSR